MRMGKPPQLRIHHFLPTSRANGPGLRSVLWLQGCRLGCPGCFNPETHSFQGGELAGVSELLEQIAAGVDQVEGLTISGGEPLHQASALRFLLAGVKEKTRLSVILFSGFSWDEIQAQPKAIRLLPYLDVLIAGRYVAAQRQASGLIGSANKSVHFLTPRYTAGDLKDIPQGEVLIGPAGDVVLSGIDPLEWG